MENMPPIPEMTFFRTSQKTKEKSVAMRLNTKQRPATTVVECAIIFPAFFFIVIGMVVMGFGIFRYQELASLTREAARYASVRGYKYSQTTGNPAATEEEIYQNIILSRAVLLNPDYMTHSITWTPDNRQNSVVTVTIRYQWIPEVLFPGIELSSTSSMNISY